MKRTLRAQADFRGTLLRNQLTSLVLFESVTTTKAKAKQLIPYVNHFLNRIKPADATAKRLAGATFFDPNATKKVFEEIMPRYSENDTTFIRHFRVMPRKGDSAEMMLVTFVKPLQAKLPKSEPTPKTPGKKTPTKTSAKSKTKKSKTK